MTKLGEPGRYNKTGVPGMGVGDPSPSRSPILAPAHQVTTQKPKL